MQMLGKDQIVLSFSGSANGKDPQLLHQTKEGFQFGFGKERQIVTDINQVPEQVFGPVAHHAVKAWLEANGPAKAEQAVMERDLNDRASVAPGTLDALAEQLGPEVKAQLFQLLRGAVKGQPLAGVAVSAETSTDALAGGSDKLPIPEKVATPIWQKVDGGWIWDKGNGHKEFVTDESKAEMDADLNREMQLVGAGASKSGTSSGEMGKELAGSRKATRAK